MRPIKYDWSAAEQAFVFAPDDGQTTLKTISDHFGIPYQTVRRYAAQHQWTSKQLDAIVPQRLRESLERTQNPYIRASIIEELKQYEEPLYATDTNKC